MTSRKQLNCKASMLLPSGTVAYRGTKEYSQWAHELGEFAWYKLPSGRLVMVRAFYGIGQ